MHHQSQHMAKKLMENCNEESIKQKQFLEEHLAKQEKTL